ncbi:MAG: glycosyltransferase [Alistipes sp.]|jgi:glycosyltransferase involved in cell wall biosynthesis|nr:glycosyltransferase [Alistipes sp.]
MISIVIATWNRGEKLELTLASLASQTLPPEEWEVVVVNNNSTDDTAAVFARFAASPEGCGLDVRMVDEPRQGLSWARNRGLDEARSEIVVMIDDDEVAGPDFLAAWRDFFASNPRAVAAGGPMRACYEEGRPRWMSHYTEALAASTIDLGRRVRPFPRGRYPIGGNMAFRREVFDRVGMFDTLLGRTGAALLGGEEKELFGRIAATGSDGGVIWWVPDAAVDHLIPSSRLTGEHFRKLSRMVGRTARLFAPTPALYARALAAEAVKWCATLVLAAWFVLTLRPAKARYLVIMRREITRGLISLS